jgi:transposase
MAWNEVEREEPRRLFIEELESGPPNFSELFREFGISQETGYKWKRRYEEEEFLGLSDRSSKPKKFRDPVSEEVVAVIIQVRIEHPTWGGTKTRKYMKNQRYPHTLPSGRTIDRLLKRVGLVRSKSRYKRAIYKKEEVIKSTKCNMVWTVDFKGW